ncbi:MAG: hypothetical protein ACYC63_11160 [Armatimonadota bacterium]
MINHNRRQGLAIVLLALLWTGFAMLWTGTAQAQKAEVRAFLGASGATDDTFQYLQSSIKSRYVCPYCSFSSAILPVPNVCPDPWNAAGHPAGLELVDMTAYACPVPACPYVDWQAGICPDPKSLGHGALQLVYRGGYLKRLLSLALPEMSAGHYDVHVANGAGAFERRAVLGRPFQPREGANVRSALHAQAAGLINSANDQGPIISAGMHGRFLIIPPTPLVADENPANPGASRRVPSRIVRARVEPSAASGGNAAWAMKAIQTPTGETALTEFSSYLKVGVNPYRVDDGDYWFVRYTETPQMLDDPADPDTPPAQIARVMSARIDIYSVTYGYDGKVTAGNVPETLVITNGGLPLEYPFTVISDSGAITLTIQGGLLGYGWSTDADVAQKTWVMGFMTRSNCRLYPGWRELYHEADGVGYRADPQFPNMDANPAGVLGLAVADWSTYVFPGKKQCWFEIKAQSATDLANFTTESPIVEPGSRANAIVLPPNATGVGTVAVQWKKDEAISDWTPPTTATSTIGYHRDNGEWQYDGTFYASGIAPRTVTNAKVADPTQPSNHSYGNGLGSHVKLLGTQFMSSRVSVRRTAQQWRPSAASPPGDVEAVNTDLAYSRQVFGWLDSISLYGNFAPGTQVPARRMQVDNRWDGSDKTFVCGTCGALFGPVATKPAACPYHPLPATPPPDVLTVAGCGGAGSKYNGTYTREGYTPDGRAYYKHDTAVPDLFLYFNVRWALSPDISLKFNFADYKDGTGTLPGQTGWQKAKLKNPPSSVTYTSSTSTGTIVEVADAAGGAFLAATDTWRAVTSIGTDERLPAPAPLVRNVLPADAFRTASTGVGHAAAPATTSMSVTIPSFQAPSVPGNGVVNDEASDRGYRGGQMLYQNVNPPNLNSGLSNGWNTFYKNPDNGYFQPAPGKWPFIAGGKVYWSRFTPTSVCPIDGQLYNLPGGACPDHAAQALTALSEAGGRHYYCPVCGSEFEAKPSLNHCPFDQAVVDDARRIPLDEAVREEHLVAEEYDPFDVQVSVNRTATRVAQNSPSVELGRTAPGVRAQRPDLTVQPLVDHRAFPSDVSPLPRYNDDSSDTRISLRNEGNVALRSTGAGATPLRLANTYDFSGGALLDQGLPHYMRLGIDPDALSYGRLAQSGPLTRDTLIPLSPTPGSNALYEAGLTSTGAWNSYAQDPNAAAGAPVSGFISAGNYNNRPDPKPVPLGQPVGMYTGKHLQYIDLDGNSAFDFYSLSESRDTNTSQSQFNPSVDLPREPLVGVLDGQTRVFETRLPHNDYYALDSDPIVLPSPTPGVMQVVWATNRSSVGGGFTPADMAKPTSGVGLVYITTTGMTGGANDELYRLYSWPTVAGALSEPSALTTFAPGVVNGQPSIMYNADQSAKFAFWHRSIRHAGGVQSTLHWNTTPNWTWPAEPINNFIFDSGLPKQGLRGFWRPAGAWLFWHSGTAGRERLMYTADFNGTPTGNKQAVVPVTNQAPAALAVIGDRTKQGETDLVTATLPTELPDGTAPVADTVRLLQRPTVSPFTYTKDASVFVDGGQVNLFFSGFVTHEGQPDICWTRFDLAKMTAASTTDNYGKIPFPSITNHEEMDSDGLHQRFGSRHLDWLVDRNFAATGATYGVGETPSVNPRLRLQLSFDTLGDGLRAETADYTIDWREGTYDRARGVYRVTPIFYGWSGALFPSDFILKPDGSGHILRERRGSNNPLTMEINIAAGTVQFSAPLFNSDAPSDPSCALRNDYVSASGYPLNDAILRINYAPYIYRVTRSGAQDDSPSAFYDPTAAQRLTVFWRRSYPASEAPHFGRPSFMYKVWTTSVQVARQPVTGGVVFHRGSVSGPEVEPTFRHDEAGIYNFSASEIGNYLYAVYQGRTERHQVIGWSREMIVPVDTVVGEGALVAVPETFGVPETQGDSDTIPAVRYWLFWTSPRGVYDLRLVENNGTRVSPGGSGVHDPAVHSSSDIYTAVVAPEFGSLAPERTISTISPEGT